MTALRLTEREARRLGINVDGAEPTSTERTRRRRPTPYRMVCHACGDELRSEAAQTRHRTATGHRRYEMPLPEETP